MSRLHFEDFQPGTTTVYGPIFLSKDEIVAFAREFDPQAFHTDEKAAKDTFLSTLIASGWHTACLNMRLLAENVLLHSTSLGSPGIEELRWIKPVKPDGALKARMTVLDAKASKSRPALGLVRFRFEVLDQHDETVMTQVNWIMFARRDAPAGIGPSERRSSKQDAEPAVFHRDAAQGILNPYLDDLIPGEVAEIGSYTFSAPDIIRFAKAFDPQPFHIDPEAAKDSLFGGLCASGWHTACIWMKLMAAHRASIEQDALGRGERPAQLGPSPGFKNLKWLKPVYAGDTISYRTILTNKRVSGSRPGWGLAFHHNTGTNQHGEEVFSFEGTVFWERRPS